MCTESAVQQFLVGVVTKQKAAARVEYRQEVLNLIMDVISLTYRREISSYPDHRL